MVSKPIPGLGVWVCSVWSHRGVCPFDPTIPWDIMRTLCCLGSVCHISYRIKEKLLAIMCSWVPLSILKYMYNLL